MNEFGHMQFVTVRPPIAELLFRLKNRADKEAAGPIIEAAVMFLAQHLEPVLFLAMGIGDLLRVPVLSCIALTRPTTQLKNVTAPEERQKLVEGLYEVDATQTRGHKILLFDDLFRSGTTMNAITDALLGPGEAAVVRALTITKTRSNH